MERRRGRADLEIKQIKQIRRTDLGCRARSSCSNSKMRLIAEGVRQSGTIATSSMSTPSRVYSARARSPGSVGIPSSSGAPRVPKAGEVRSADVGIVDDGGIVLTSKLATRLVAELGDAYQNSLCLNA